MSVTLLPQPLLDTVLQRLGFTIHPGTHLQALKTIYTAWCQRVPFDNVRKLIHLCARDPSPLPGDDPEDFFNAWLQHGTGGTCWAGNGALQALLVSLGFNARHGIATMLAAPDLPPNHGTVSVHCEDATYLLDASMLHGEPLRLNPDGESALHQGAWGVRCRPQNGKWIVRWRPLHQSEGMDCRIDRLDGTRQDFAMAHEQTRGWSPFNFELHLRTNREDAVIGIARGRRTTFHADGQIASEPLAPADRKRYLIDVIGLSESIVTQLPDDVPTPPPPGSRTAQRSTASGGTM